MLHHWCSPCIYHEDLTRLRDDNYFHPVKRTVSKLNRDKGGGGRESAGSEDEQEPQRKKKDERMSHLAEEKKDSAKIGSLKSIFHGASPGISCLRDGEEKVIRASQR